MTATVARAEVQNGTAYVTIVNDCGLMEARTAVREAFAGLGVTMDPRANSYRSSVSRGTDVNPAGFLLYSQKVGA